jgi:hypothetical protein
MTWDELKAKAKEQMRQTRRRLSLWAVIVWRGRPRKLCEECSHRMHEGGYCNRKVRVMLAGQATWLVCLCQGSRWLDNPRLSPPDPRVLAAARYRG